MNKLKYWITEGWHWLKHRQLSTLAAGAAIGVVLDEPVMWLIGWMF